MAEREFLSKTQVEIVRHLSRGLTNQEIAEQLSITVGTTKWHLHQIYRELGGAQPHRGGCQGSPTRSPVMRPFHVTTLNRRRFSWRLTS